MTSVQEHKELMIHLGQCGVMTLEQFKNLSTQKDVLDELINLGYIYIKDEVIQLTLLGQRHIERYYREEVPHRHITYIINHDIKVMDIYMNLSEEERRSWLTRESLQTMSSASKTFDAMYVNDKKEKVCICVLKKDTNKKVIHELEMTSRDLQADYPSYSFY